MYSFKKKQVLLLLLTPAIALLLHSFSEQQPSAMAKVKERYAGQLEKLQASLQSFRQDITAGKEERWIGDLKQCRLVYKSVEPLIAYYYPQIAKRLNGPALMEAEVLNPNESVLPTGFQVLEVLLYEEEPLRLKEKLWKQLGHVIVYIDLLHSRSQELAPGKAELYDAIRLNLCTMASLGLSGFDTPLLLTAIDEAKVTIAETSALLTAMEENGPVVQDAISRCLLLLQASGHDFNTFDRARFLSVGWNTLLLALRQQQQAHHIPFVVQRRAIRTNAASFFDTGAFDPYFFAPDALQPARQPEIDLGRALFSEPALSASGRSCAGCHQPGRAYTDGMDKNLSLQSDEQLQRNTPTLINAALQPVLFADGRLRFLEEQAHDVMLNKKEMDGRPGQAVAALSASPAYRKMFRNAFPGQDGRISQETIIVALAAFERSLIALDAPFDRFMRGDSLAMSRQQQQGFNLFMGKAKCGTCHFMPLFNGAVPPFYDRQDTEIIGVPEMSAAAVPRLDDDLGVYDLFRFPVKKGAFKTPTVRNAASTAPYMHNGIFNTLEEVVDFYDRGGGAGLGIVMEIQTLPTDKLNLEPGEKAALIAFIQALSDTVVSTNHKQKQK